MSSGKSKSLLNPFGVRRCTGGFDLAPKSLRLQDKATMMDCSTKEQIDAGVRAERRRNDADIEEDRRK